LAAGFAVRSIHQPVPGALVLRLDLPGRFRWSMHPIPAHGKRPRISSALVGITQDCPDLVDRLGTDLCHQFGPGYPDQAVFGDHYSGHGDRHPFAPRGLVRTSLSLGRHHESIGKITASDHPERPKNR
jgi:hypothetical protein